MSRCVLLPVQSAAAAELGLLRQGCYTEPSESGKDNGGEDSETNSPSLSGAADLLAA